MDRLREAASGGSAHGAKGGVIPEETNRIATVPNLLSFLRLALIPAMVWLLLGETQAAQAWGIILLLALVATDWIDGWVARRYNQVSKLGKVLDPTADRLVIAAGLISLMIADLFPLWAGLLVLGRDLVVMSMAGYMLSKGKFIEIRWIGKSATFALMGSIPAIAWANAGLPPEAIFLAFGWFFYAIGVVEYYVAAGLYVGDIREALGKA